MTKLLILSALFLLPVVVMLFVGVYINLDIIEQRRLVKCENRAEKNKFLMKNSLVNEPVTEHSIKKERLKMLNFGPKHKLRMYVHQDMDVVSNYMADGRIWEEDEINWVIEKLKQSRKGYFLDVGCNIGTFSLFVSSKGFSSTCVEGLLSNLEIISMNVKMNKLEQKIKILPYAVSDVEMECGYYSGSINIANGELSCPDNYKGQMVFRQKVFTKRLEDILPKNIVYDVIKLDIEGKEFSALKGMHDYLRNNCVKYILFEMHHHSRAAGYYEFYESLNYSIYFFQKFTLVNKDTFYSFVGSSNFVAIKEC